MKRDDTHVDGSQEDRQHEARSGTGHGQVVRSQLLVTLVLDFVFGALQTAIPRERGPRVEVVCPRPPIPVRIGEHSVLVYELHVTNFDKVPLTLSELKVFGDTDMAQPLQSVSGDVLGAMMVDVGASESVKEQQKIDPGKRTVVFLWIALERDIRMPHRLRHRMVFVSGDTKKNGAAGTSATLMDFPVEVADELVPVLSPPFREGVWVAGDGPGNESGHRRSLLAIDGHVHAPERFASDWVKVGPNGDSRQGTARNEDYWAYGEPVLAVADGEVTQVQDGIADNSPHVLPQPVTLDNIMGNYIILRIAPDRYVAYAHLEKGSVVVAPHQRVLRGDVIARLGNSGQATAPHLHLEVTDGDSGLAAEGVPFVFAQFTDFGPGSDYEGDKHPLIPRSLALPGKDEVVGWAATQQKSGRP